MNKRKRNYISKIEVFQGISSREMEEIDRQTTMNNGEPERVFFASNKTGEALFLLKKGWGSSYRLSPKWKELVVVVIVGSAVFVEISLVGQGMHNSLAGSIENCILCVKSHQDVERIIIQKPLVALRFVESMAQRLQTYGTKREDFAFMGIPARLANLMDHSREAGQGDIAEYYLHQDLADMLGTSRETTTQILNN